MEVTKVFRVWGQGGLASKLVLEISGVVVWLTGFISIVTKSP